MTPEAIRKTYLEELVTVAPDLDPQRVGDNDHIQADLELDTTNVLDLVTALQDRLGVIIPEVDYPGIATPALAVAYLAQAIGRKNG